MIFKMIISHKYKFIFIKTKKTASSIIEIYLSQLCDEDDIVTPLLENVTYKQNPRNWYYNKYNKFFYNHIPARIIRYYIGEKDWNNYYKFCVERNPFDKTISHYYYRNSKRRKPVTFDEYLRKCNFCYNYKYYCDTNNNIIVDKIIKYENVNDELRKVLLNFGIKFNELNIYEKSGYRPNKHYRDFYDDYQKNIIENAFDFELKLHNYKF